MENMTATMIGNIRLVSIKKFFDLTFNELLVILPLLVFVVLLGIYPNLFFKFVKLFCNNIILQEFY